MTTLLQHAASGSKDALAHQQINLSNATNAQPLS